MIRGAGSCSDQLPAADHETVFSPGSMETVGERGPVRVFLNPNG